MKDKNQMSSYQRAIQKLAIYENAIKEALEIIDDKDLSKLNGQKLGEIKMALIQARMRVYNL